jgi:hypothetical protein
VSCRAAVVGRCCMRSVHSAFSHSVCSEALSSEAVQISTECRVRSAAAPIAPERSRRAPPPRVDRIGSLVCGHSSIAATASGRVVDGVLAVCSCARPCPASSLPRGWREAKLEGRRPRAHVHVRRCAAAASCRVLRWRWCRCRRCSVVDAVLSCAARDAIVRENCCESCC